MKDSLTTNSPVPSAIANLPVVDVEAVGLQLTRYGLVLVLAWIGGMKFTHYEAYGIKGFVENSPLMSFFYHIFSVRSFSTGLGVLEIVIALMIAARPWFAKVSALGSLLAAGMFLTTLSFLITTPGVFEASEGGFPALSIPGQFLVKDFVLVGASVLSLGEALKSIQRER